MRSMAPATTPCTGIVRPPPPTGLPHESSMPSRPARAVEMSVHPSLPAHDAARVGFASVCRGVGKGATAIARMLGDAGPRESDPSEGYIC